MKQKYTDINTQNIDSEYENYRADEILRYSWIKMLVGSLVVLFYLWTDLHVKQSVFSAAFRLIPLFSIFIFISLQLLVFKRDKRNVLLFFNMVIVSLIIMMYGIIIVDSKTPFFYQSTEGAILVLAIAGIEMRGNIKTILLSFIVPMFLMITFLIFYFDWNELNIMHITHLLALGVVSSVYCIVKERVHYNTFKTKMYLEFEKQRGEELNQSLHEHAEEINAQKEEISVQRDEAELQKQQLESQKIELVSNLKYATRLQSAIQPSQEYLSKILPDCFVLSKPRDIVSGDFYWAANVDEWAYFAVADCTGHGVSAAFMSIIGITSLNEIIKEEQSLTPALLLNKLREKIIAMLHQSNEVLDSKDGMDVAMCAFHRKSGRLIFSGANSSLVIVRNQAFIPELKHIKGDKMPVSVHLRMDSFNNIEFELMTGDMVYLFSDGYSDQFGGTKGKKIKMKQFKTLLNQNSHLPLKEQHAFLQQYIDRWMKVQNTVYDQTDDITVMGVRIIVGHEAKS